MMDTTYLLTITLLAIILLLVLVIRFNIHAFIALLVASIAVGVGTGLSPAELFKSIQDGMGGVLGFVAVIVGLGAIFGQLMESSGGAEVMARSLLRWFGEKKAPWALTLTGFIISIPIFLDIGFIMLVTIVYALARKTGKSTLYYAIPLLAGLAVTHSFVPPTPGPVAVAEILQVPLGWVIFFGILIGLPVAVLAGPVFGRFIAKRVMAHPPALEPVNDHEETNQERKMPGFLTVMALILLPLLLIMVGTLIEILLEGQYIQGGALWIDILLFLGHPFSALLLATLGAIWFFGHRMGYSSREVLEIANKSLAPAGLIILVTGAGGMFKQILIDSGVGKALAETMTSWNIPMLVLAYLLALIIRVTQGSATVAMITAAGMVAPALELIGLSDMQTALIVIAIGAGATTFSHVNDSGFWLVNRYLYISEKDTLRSWTMMETIISVSAFLLALLLSFFVA